MARPARLQVPRRQAAVGYRYDMYCNKGLHTEAMYFLPAHILNAVSDFTLMYLRENRMHKRVSRTRMAWWKTVNHTSGVGRNLSPGFPMQEALRGSGRRGSRSGKGGSAITESLLGNGLCGARWGNSMALKPQVALHEWWLGHQVGSCAGIGLLGSGSPLLQKARSQQVFPCSHQQVTSWASYAAVQNPDLALRCSPKVGFMGSVRDISVLWALCYVVLRVRKTGSLWHLGIVAMKGLMFEDEAPLDWNVSMCHQ